MSGYQPAAGRAELGGFDDFARFNQPMTAGYDKIGCRTQRFPPPDGDTLRFVDAATIALEVSILSLLFSAGSFWWLNGRPAKLMAYQPSTFSASVDALNTQLILPLVVHNLGSPTAAVLNLRVRVHTSPMPIVLDWHTTREDVSGMGTHETACPFVVDGRSSVRVIAFFAREHVYPYMLGQELQVTVEAQTSKSHPRWQKLVTFPLLAQVIHSPTNLIPYSNLPEMMPADSADQSRVALAELERARSAT